MRVAATLHTYELAADLETYDRVVREGAFWLRTASNAGSAQASYQLGRAYEQSIGVPRDMHAALEMYQWSVECAKTSKHLSKT